MNRLRKPGPATSVRSTAWPSRSATSAPRRSATARGGSPEGRRQQHRGVASSSRRTPPSGGARASPRRRRRRLRSARPRPRERPRRPLLRGRRGFARHLSNGMARPPGSCSRGRSARAGPRGRAGAAGSSGRATRAGRRRPCRGPRGPPTTKQRSWPDWRRSSRKRLNANRVVLAPVGRQQADVGALGDPALDRLVLAHLDQLEPRVPGQQLLVVLDVVRVRWAEAPDGYDQGPDREEATSPPGLSARAPRPAPRRSSGPSSGGCRKASAPTPAGRDRPRSGARSCAAPRSARRGRA